MLANNDYLIIKDILDEITNTIKISNVKLNNDYNDGRINSSINEELIVNLVLENKGLNEILNYYDGYIIVPKARDWYDLAIKIKGNFIPINIKITNLKQNTADNLNCKLGIYYCLTGIIPTFSNQINWQNYFKILKQHLNMNNKDYYFLIVDKLDVKNSFWTSLKMLEELKINGNNLPFQCVWNQNKKHIHRNYECALEFILDALKESINKRAMIVDSFRKFFN